MAKLTVTVDEALLNRARLRALEQNTSLTAVLRGYLESYAGLSAEREAAVRAVLELSEAAVSRHEGPRWTRDEFHER